VAKWKRSGVSFCKAGEEWHKYEDVGQLTGETFTASLTKAPADVRRAADIAADEMMLDANRYREAEKPDNAEPRLQPAYEELASACHSLLRALGEEVKNEKGGK